MPTIKPKLTIKSGVSYIYDPATFAQYIPEWSIEVKTAEEMIKLFKDDTLLFMDTEDKPLPVNNEDVPEGIVRRFIDSGKKAKPVDVPFIVSIGNGKVFASLFDMDWEHGLPEITKLKAWIESVKTEKVFHNARFDRHMLANAKIYMRGKVHDTIFLVKNVDENKSSYKLRDLAVEVGGSDVFEIMVDLYKKQHKIQDYSKLPHELVLHYANTDIYNLYCVWKYYWPLLQADPDAMKIYETEIQLQVAIYESERLGMKLNMDIKDTVQQTFQEEMETAENKVYATAGEMFNMNSTQQVHKVMLKLGAKEEDFKYSDKGNVKLDKDEMERFRLQGYEIVENILEFKEAKKLLETYAVGIYRFADPNGYVHASVNADTAITGRMSITNPPLQTIPKKNKSVKRIFIPPHGYKFINADYVSQEYKLYAHYMKDPGIIEKMWQGLDFHKLTAMIVFDVEYDEVTKDQRQKAKTINFAMIYGVGNAHLAELLSEKGHIMTITEAAALRRKYFRALPMAQSFMNAVQKLTRDRGWIRNYYGRKRHLTKNECYKAVNSLIQGCAADMTKAKWLRIYKYLKQNKLKSRVVNAVHDSLMYYIKDEEFDEHLPKIISLQEDLTNFRVPVNCDVEDITVSWGDAEEIKVGRYEFSEEELNTIDSFNVWEMDMNIGSQA